MLSQESLSISFYNSTVMSLLPLGAAVSVAPYLSPPINQLVSYVADKGFAMLAMTYQTMQSMFSERATLPFSLRSPAPCLSQPVWFTQDYKKQLQSVERDASSSLENFALMKPELMATDDAKEYPIDLGFFRLHSGHFAWSFDAPTSSETTISCKEAWQFYNPDPQRIFRGEFTLTYVRDRDIPFNEELWLKDRVMCASLKREIIFAHFVLALKGTLSPTNIYSSHLFHSLNFGIIGNDFEQINQLPQQQRDFIAAQPFTICTFVSLEKTRFSGPFYMDLSAVIIGYDDANKKICPKNSEEFYDKKPGLLKIFRT